MRKRWELFPGFIASKVSQLRFLSKSLVPLPTETAFHRLIQTKLMLDEYFPFCGKIKIPRKRRDCGSWVRIPKNTILGGLGHRTSLIVDHIFSFWCKSKMYWEYLHLIWTKNCSLEMSFSETTHLVVILGIIQMLMELGEFSEPFVSMFRSRHVGTHKNEIITFTTSPSTKHIEKMSKTLEVGFAELFSSELKNVKCWGCYWQLERAGFSN